MAIIGQNNFSDRARYGKAVLNNPKAPRALCFGDSWFQYVPHPTDLNKQLAKAFRGTLFLNEAVAGRDSVSWKAGLPRVQREIADFRFDAILLSNGGNDIVGQELPEFIKTAAQAQSIGATAWGELPEEVCEYVRLETFEHALAYAIKDFKEVVQYRDMYAPDSIVYVHTYDYVYPSGSAFKLGPFKLGPWVKPYLEAVSLADPAAQRILTRWLQDQYRRELKAFVSQNRNMRLIDSLGTLTTAQQWENEIHPTAKGFEKIAKRCWVPALTGLLA
jgi:hypothetical protein